MRGLSSKVDRIIIHQSRIKEEKQMKCPNGHFENLDDCEYLGDEEKCEVENWKFCPVCGSSLIESDPIENDDEDEEEEDEKELEAPK